ASTATKATGIRIGSLASKAMGFGPRGAGGSVVQATRSAAAARRAKAALFFNSVSLSAQPFLYLGGLENIDLAAKLAGAGDDTLLHHFVDFVTAEGLQHRFHALARTMAGKFDRGRFIGAHAILVEEAEQKPVRLQGRVEQLVILDRIEQDRGAVPVFFLFGERARIFALAIPRQTAIARDVLNHDRAGTPVFLRPRRLAVIIRSGSKPDAGRHLFRIRKI